jgi:hypothetical protein
MPKAGSLRSQSALGLRGQALKAIRIIHRQIGENLAI